MATQQLVKYDIMTTVVNIPNFSGEPNTIDINQFIKQVDTLISNKGITSEKLKIEAFKQNIDPQQGDARNVIGYRQLEKIGNYKDYLQAFKKHFLSRSDQDPLRGTVKLMTIKRNSSDSFSRYLLSIDNWGRDWEEMLKASKWIDQEDPSKMTVSQVAKFLMFT